MRRGPVARRTIAVLSAAALGVTWGGCSVRHELPPQDLSLGQRLAVRPCDEDGARVELVGVRPYVGPHNPSADIDDYLVDLRVRSAADRWLIVNQEIAPSGVDEVSKHEQGSGWWLGLLEAYFIQRGGDVTLRDLREGVGKDAKLPAMLARVTVDYKTPQRWVEEDGQVDHRFALGGKPVPLYIDVYCVSWFDVHAPAQAAAP